MREKMATKCSFEIALLLVLFFTITEAFNSHLSPPKLFDVLKYGAVANGNTDNSQAFLRAWKDACMYGGRSMVLIPKGTYMLGSLSFVGPCKAPITVVIKGTLKAPTDPRQFFKDTWIGFRYVNKLTVNGGGYLDGQGSAAWKFNDCHNNTSCLPLPATMRFDFITNSRVHNLISINSKNTHFNIFACDNINITYLNLTAPATSPNTDGIHIGSSTRIKISNSVISTGDDCVAMVSGSHEVDISNVTCGPGHGISIGSLGRSHAREEVTGISVRNCTFHSTDNGVRIKTWEATWLQSLAANITFQDIVMKYVHNPIVIDQQYCPLPHCLNVTTSNFIHMGNSAVQVQDVVFKNIRGISSTKVAVNIQCSGALPCRNVKLIDISLAYEGRGGPATAVCSKVLGSSYGKQIPAGCL